MAKNFVEETKIQGVMGVIHSILFYCSFFLKEFAADIKKYTKEHEHDDEIEEVEEIPSPSKVLLQNDNEVVLAEDEDAIESESKEDHELMKEGLIYYSL